VDEAKQPALLGARLTRLEDDRLLTGRGTYVADISRPGMLEVAFVRSPFAHARVRSIDVEAARTLPGVVAAVTAADLTDVKPFPDFFDHARPVGARALSGDRVRYVGAPVAAIVGESRYVAEDAAELVRVDYEALPAVDSIESASAPDAPRLYEEWPDNVLVDVPGTDPEVDGIFGRARRIAGRFRVQRQAAVPLETRGVVAAPDGGRVTVWTATQFPHIVRTTLSYVLPVREMDIRVIAPDVGGGFGGKCSVYQEEVLVPYLALKLLGPVRWIEDRAEHMVGSSHARDEIVELEAAVEDDGTILALRGRILQDLGSGETFPAGFCPAFVLWGSLTGPYRIPHQEISVTSVVTNKTPSGAYRGFGMPEATFAMERLLDRIARELLLDPIDLRRRLLLRPDELPYITPSGARLDSGSHREAFEHVVAAAVDRRREVQRSLEPNPNVRIGVGFANYVEGTVGSFFSTSGHWTSPDTCTLRVDPQGGVVASVGVSTAGQGLHTMVATLAAESLGMPIDAVRVVMGDTDMTPYGLGGWGSRSTGVMAGAIRSASAIIRGKALKIASQLLETAIEDLQTSDGEFFVRGTDRHVSWADVARVAIVRTLDLPSDVEPGLEATVTFDPPNIAHVPDEFGRANGVSTYTNSSHAAVATVDVETGAVELQRYIVAHDCGRVVNPNLVEGQIQGGVAQGIGGTLLEMLPYDSEGQPLATSFMDYLLPTSAEVPSIEITHFETPAPEMPYGVKGAGEAGIIGPAAAIANAIEDALSAEGVMLGSIASTPLGQVEVLHLVREAQRGGASQEERGRLARAST
jgi:aerobic carbon-monoxide dehydrogenase large subunit